MARKKTQSPARKLTDADYRLLAEFRGLLRRFLAFSEDAAREAGLSPQQHQALLLVRGFDGHGPPTVGDLAARLAIRHNSAVGLVDRLAQTGFLARHADPADKRRVTLALTRTAERVLEGLTAAHRDELRRMAPLLKPLLSRLEE